VERLCEKYSGGIYCIELFDYIPTFFTHLDQGHEEMEDVVYDDEIEELSDVFIIPDNLVSRVECCILHIPDNLVSRVECCILHILDDGIYWSCTGKHTDVHIETPRLSYKLLFGE